MAGEFDFIKSFRDVDPDTDRALIEARQKSHAIIQSDVKIISRVFDLCKIAYLLDPPNDIEWFVKPIRDFDPHFLIAKDKVEAGKIAALLLRERITWAGTAACLSSLTASFCGKRHSADGDILTKEAAVELTGQVRSHRTFAKGKQIPVPKFKSSAEQIAALAASPTNGDLAKQALEAVTTSTEAAVKVLAEAAVSSQAAVRADILRLAEEVDMLWWYIGDWHELLARPRSAQAIETRIIATGVELGSMVKSMPGPFGAYGLLRRAAGTEGETITTLREAISAVSQEDAAKLTQNKLTTLAGLAPVHAALHARWRSGPAWPTEAGGAIADVLDVEISNFELGLQVYRERILVESDGWA